MLHIWKCNKCGGRIESYCGEHYNYTEEGYKTRCRQMQSGLCIPCFGETPELKSTQTPLPCFNPETGNIEARITRNENASDTDSKPTKG